MTQVDLLIGGATRAASSGRRFQRLNPVTGEPASSAAAATLEDADDAVEAASAAFPAWAALGPGERRVRLSRAADSLESKSDQFRIFGREEIGGAPNWYSFNVKLAADMLREAAAMTTQIGGEIIPSNVPGSLAMAIRQPAGVVLGMAPWNAPVILGVRALAMPLACGNTVVLKASEICPAVHRLIGTALQESGLGDGVVNVLTNAIRKPAPRLPMKFFGQSGPNQRNSKGTGVFDLLKLLAGHPLVMQAALSNLDEKSSVKVLKALRKGNVQLNRSEARIESIMKCIN